MGWLLDRAVAGPDDATQPLAWLESFRVEIIDSDSIRSGGEVYRLVGFNTPESGANAGCQHERALSRAATDRLSQLVASGGIDLRRVPCACAPGTEGSGQCNYGRYCATLSVRGQDVGATLIGEGLAEPYVCTKTSLPAAQGLVPLLKLAPTVRSRVSNALASC